MAVNKKKIFLQTLMEMLETTPLDNITVTALVKKCGVSRQSFYYYFNDVYDVLKCIYEEASQRILVEHLNVEDWKQGFTDMLYWFREMKNVITNAYNPVSREYIENIMNMVLGQYLMGIIRHESKGVRVNDDQCRFIAKFYTFALNDIVIDWIANGMEEQPEELADKLELVLEGNFLNCLFNFETFNMKRSNKRKRVLRRIISNRNKNRTE